MLQAIAASEQADVVVLSDYNKGTLSPVLQPLIAHCQQQGIPVLVDPKGHDFSRYQGATLLTPNLSEFAAVVAEAVTDENLEYQAQALLVSCQLDALLVTRSEKGMSLFQPQAAAFHLPTQVQEVYDVTGAGDTVIATLATAIAAGYSLHDATLFANNAAGIVVGKMGTAMLRLPNCKLPLFVTPLHDFLYVMKRVWEYLPCLF